ncbi:MAG: cation transporter [Clostridia bacterium]|nr:cation transporter [Clostridia bacterium]
MKTERKIFIAFILNLAFSVFEFIGGLFTGSVAILSDAIHDIGDAASIGASFFLEKKSKRQPDEKYTYGYARYSVIGSVITTLILLVGSLIVVYNAVGRIIEPTEINYDGMIIFALVGAGVNFCAAFFTRGGESLNQRAVNLHMLEDVLGWLIVLVGAIVMRFTDLAVIDPIMSIGVAIFIFINAIRNLKEAIDLFLEKTPHGIDVHELCEHIQSIEGVSGVHHIHVWSMDGQSNFATMHVVAKGDTHKIKELVRAELAEHGIGHATLELEQVGEHCHEEHCHVEHKEDGHHHHHHHHGHHHH